MKFNIHDIAIVDCYGCAVCAIICPKQIINTGINEDGFFQPYLVTEKDCIKCGLCVDVCSFYNDGLSLDPDRVDSYAGWSNDKGVRQTCSTGGVGYELAATALSKGYKVCAVRYNAQKNIAEHFISSNYEGLKDSVGSKYIQSDTLAGMKKMDVHEKYILFGTPCHIDSFRRYLRKIKKEDNFILVDFFCHGVPSYLLWYKYLEVMREQTGKIKNVSWRSKKNGWHDSWVMTLRGEKGNIQSKLSDGDLFLRSFLSDSCLGKVCYDNCKFKYRNSSADIRIGDAWGRFYQNNSKGVNAVVCLTEKGRNLLHESNCTIISHEFDEIAEYQMRHNATRPFIFTSMWKLLRADNLLNMKKLELLLDIQEAFLIPKKVLNKIMKILK